MTAGGDAEICCSQKSLSAALPSHLCGSPTALAQAPATMPWDGECPVLSCSVICVFLPAREGQLPLASDGGPPCHLCPSFHAVQRGKPFLPACCVLS